MKIWRLRLLTTLCALAFLAFLGLRDQFTTPMKGIPSSQENRDETADSRNPNQLSGTIEFIHLNIQQKSTTINQTSYGIPLLIELDRDLAYSTQSEFTDKVSRESLLAHSLDISTNRFFLLIDSCENIQPNHRSIKKGLCLAGGKGGSTPSMTTLDKNIKYSSNGVRKLLGLPEVFAVHRVAHAGGGVDNRVYTNSHEALDSNVELGFRYFELDFSITKDNEVVCIHDWKNNFTRVFGYSINEAPTLEEFIRLVDEKSEYQQCTLESLAKWMVQNPSAYIVTDVAKLKHTKAQRNIEALELIHSSLPDASFRVIPQIYTPENFAKVKAIGYEQVIWTLYRFRKARTEAVLEGTTHEEVIGWVKKFPGAFAITMTRELGRTTLPRVLRDLDIPTYVHTINSPKELDEFTTTFGVTEIYTDHLSPQVSRDIQ